MGLALVRRQSLLVLLVGALLGFVAAGLVLSRQGLSGPLAIQAGSLLAAPEAAVPARIEIGAPAQPRPAAGATSPVAPPSDTPPAVPTAPAPTPDQVVVVPAPVYSYPDDHGGRHGGHGGHG